jgi:hypothetical protein
VAAGALGGVVLVFWRSVGIGVPGIDPPVFQVHQVAGSKNARLAHPGANVLPSRKTLRLLPMFSRFLEMVRQAAKNESCIPCHATTYEQAEGEAVCRGFFERHAIQPLQIAERLGFIVWQEP